MSFGTIDLEGFWQITSDSSRSGSGNICRSFIKVFFCSSAFDFLKRRRGSQNHFINLPCSCHLWLNYLLYITPIYFILIFRTILSSIPRWMKLKCSSLLLVYLLIRETIENCSCSCAAYRILSEMNFLKK